MWQDVASRWAAHVTNLLPPEAEGFCTPVLHSKELGPQALTCSGEGYLLVRALFKHHGAYPNPIRTLHKAFVLQATKPLWTKAPHRWNHLPFLWPKMGGKMGQPPAKMEPIAILANLATRPPGPSTLDGEENARACRQGHKQNRHPNPRANLPPTFGMSLD